MSDLNNQTSNLIVDFPSNPRQRTSSKSVRFAEHGDGEYIKYPTREIHKRWYSKQDEKGFKDRVWYDAVKCSRVLMDIQDGLKDRNQSKKFLVHCVGVEHLLSRTDVSEQNDSIRRKRKVHASVVLEEYKKQKESGAFSTMMLARVSGASSKSARKRAHTRASMNANLTD